MKLRSEKRRSPCETQRLVIAILLLIQPAQVAEGKRSGPKVTNILRDSEGLSVYFVGALGVVRRLFRKATHVFSPR